MVFKRKNASFYPKREKRSLLDILIMVGIATVCLALLLIILNPKKNFADENNAQRRADVLNILNAIDDYEAANNGALPNSLVGVTTATPIGSALGKANLCADLVPTYLADIPVDPTNGGKTPSNANCSAANVSYGSGYTVAVTGKRITVTAPSAENGAVISVTR